MAEYLLAAINWDYWTGFANGLMWGSAACAAAVILAHRARRL